MRVKNHMFKIILNNRLIILVIVMLLSNRAVAQTFNSEQGLLIWDFPGYQYDSRFEIKVKAGTYGVGTQEAALYLKNISQSELFIKIETIVRNNCSDEKKTTEAKTLKSGQSWGGSPWFDGFGVAQNCKTTKEYGKTKDGALFKSVINGVSINILQVKDLTLEKKEKEVEYERAKSSINTTTSSNSKAKTTSTPNQSVPGSANISSIINSYTSGSSAGNTAESTNQKSAKQQDNSTPAKQPLTQAQLDEQFFAKQKANRADYDARIAAVSKETNVQKAYELGQGISNAFLMIKEFGAERDRKLEEALRLGDEYYKKKARVLNNYEIWCNKVNEVFNQPEMYEKNYLNRTPSLLTSVAPTWDNLLSLFDLNKIDFFQLVGKKPHELKHLFKIKDITESLETGRYLSLIKTPSCFYPFYAASLYETTVYAPRKSSNYHTGEMIFDKDERVIGFSVELNTFKNNYTSIEAYTNIFFSKFQPHFIQIDANTYLFHDKVVVIEYEYFYIYDLNALKNIIKINHPSTITNLPKIGISVKLEDSHDPALFGKNARRAIVESALTMLPDYYVHLKEKVTEKNETEWIALEKPKNNLPLDYELYTNRINLLTKIEKEKIISKTSNIDSAQKELLYLSTTKDGSKYRIPGIKVDSVLVQGPADKAGIKKDDLILSVNDIPIFAAYQLQLLFVSGNTKFKVKYMRGNLEHQTIISF